ncbi:hypothetical protein ACQZV8_13800 [Magnetococcales bacterium HHB-1]
MNLDKLRKRLRKDRPMKTISLRMPEDVVEDLKGMAPLLGFSGYQPLMRHYIGQGMRVDLEKLEDSKLQMFVNQLQALGVDDTVIEQALTATAEA